MQATIFLTFFIAVFGDYETYVSTSYLRDGKLVPATFNKVLFAQSRKDGPIGELLQNYIHSQMFEVFISIRVEPKYVFIVF